MWSKLLGVFGHQALIIDPSCGAGLVKVPDWGGPPDDALAAAEAAAVYIDGLLSDKEACTRLLEQVIAKYVALSEEELNEWQVSILSQRCVGGHKGILELCLKVPSPDTDAGSGGTHQENDDHNFS
jgi:hypothetical protein